MAQARRPIKRLSLETQKQVKSLVQITSLPDVVLELVKNSLDAGARSIKIRLDFAKGYCSVNDDGIGIHHDEFLDGGGLARPYYSSKEHQSTSYGRYGHFLASLAEVGHLRIISSSNPSIPMKTLVSSFGRRNVMALDTEEEQVCSGQGTMVIVHNLFGNLPVRVKYRLARYDTHAQLEKDFFDLKIQLTSLILAYGLPINLVITDTNGQRQFIHKPLSTAPAQNNLERIISTVSQAGIVGTDKKDWQKITVQTSHFVVHAAICLKPYLTRKFQFLSIGKQPIHHQLLLQEVNKLFQSSNSWGVPQDTFTEGNNHYVKSQSYKHKGQHIESRKSGHGMKASDRWPVFYIRLDMVENDHDSLRRFLDVQNITDERLGAILDVLRITIEEFFTSQGHFKRLKSTKIRSHPDQKPTSSVPSQRSDHNFANWSRTKATNPEIACDILTGLSFTNMDKDACTSLKIPVSLISDKDKFEHDVHESQHEEHLLTNDKLWIDPTTGQVIRLNARTGMALPDQPTLHQETDDYHNTQSMTVLSRLGAGNLEETVRGLQLNNWIKNSAELPISSVSSICDSHLQHDTSRQNRNTPQGKIALQQIILSNGENSSNISKIALHSAKVIGQIDKKFILISIHLENMILVMVDQHAADERIKLEKLFAQLCTNKATILPIPIVFEVTLTEAKLFRNVEKYLSSWQIAIEVNETNISVKELPELIAERCHREPNLLIEILRREVWDMPAGISLASDDWLIKIGSCLQGILDLLVSRACRSAIMFNDILSFEECQTLVHELSRCHFPFQCGHGRPSMAILTRLEGVNDFGGTTTFKQAWNAWVESY